MINTKKIVTNYIFNLFDKIVSLLLSRITKRSKVQ